MDNNVLHIFSNCFFTKGAKRSLIFDIQHYKTLFVPNSMVEFVKTYHHKTKAEIFADFETSNHETLNEYFDFILKNLIGAFLPQKSVKNFTELNLSYNSPYLFENVIVDIGQNSTQEVIEILQKLDQIKIPYIQIRFSDQINFEILKILENLSFISVEIVVKFGTFKETDFKTDPKISNIFIYNAPKEKVEEFHKKQFIYKTKSNFDCCGLVTKQTFSTTPQHIYLSQKYNSCLYKKLYISENGEIKNCPQGKNFGNIFDLSSQEISNFLQEKEFVKFWNITKDKISICQDCEFRYVCTDCRYILQNKNNPFSKPANCSYNPYICKWQGEEGWISVEQWRKENPDWKNETKI